MPVIKWWILSKLKMPDIRHCSFTIHCPVDFDTMGRLPLYQFHLKYAFEMALHLLFYFMHIECATQFLL